MASSRGSRVLGGGRIRRLFKTLPETVGNEIGSVLQSAAPKLLAGMQAAARTVVRVVSGALLGGLSYKFYPKTLRLRVGFFRRNAPFYAAIIENGRKRPKTSRPVHLRRRDGTITTFTRKLNPVPAKHIVYSRQTNVRREINDRLKGIWSRAIRAASAGAGSDDD